MTWNELNNIVKALEEKIKMTFEQTRMIVYSIYQVNSSKRLKPTDVLKFKWDDESEIDVSKLMNVDEAERLINNITNGKETI